MLKKRPKSQLEKIDEDYQAALYERDVAAREQRHYETLSVLFFIALNVSIYSDAFLMTVFCVLGSLITALSSIRYLGRMQRFERELNRLAKDYQDIQKHPFLGGHTP